MKFVKRNINEERKALWSVVVCGGSPLMTGSHERRAVDFYEIACKIYALLFANLKTPNSIIIIPTTANASPLFVPLKTSVPDNPPRINTIPIIMLNIDLITNNASLFCSETKINSYYSFRRYILTALMNISFSII